MGSHARSRRLPLLAAVALLALAALAPSAHATPYSDAVNADNPWGYWRLEETGGSTAADASGGGHAGAFKLQPAAAAGSLQLGIPGAVQGRGTGIQDGRVEVSTCPATPTFANLRDFTVEGWVKWTGNVANSPQAAIWDLGTNGQSAIFGTNAAQNWFAGVFGLDGGVLGSPAIAGPPGMLNSGYHHFAIVRDGTSATPSLKLYLDGNLVSQKTTGISATGYTGDSHMAWGNLVGGSAGIQGSLDELAFYTHPLSSAAVAGHYAARLGSPGDYASAVKADSPWGYWPLDEAAGPVAADASGHHRPASYDAGGGPIAPGAAGAVPGSTGATVDGGRVLVSNLAQLDCLVPPFDDLRDFTLESWVRFDDAPAGQGALFEGVTNGQSLLTGVGNALGRFAGVFGLDGGSLGSPAVVSPGGQRGTGWHHVAFVRDGTAGTLTLFLDGQQVDQKASGLSSTGYTVQGLLAWGSTVGGFAPIHGALDELAIYTHPLSAARIAAHYGAENTTQAVPANGTATFPAAADAPVATSIESPVAGAITVQQSPTSGSPPSGFQFLGYQLDVTAPTPPTGTAPLVLTFTLGPDALTGVPPASVQAVRDSATIATCPPGGIDVNDPQAVCVANRVNGTDSVTFTIHSMHASRWSFQAPAAQAAVSSPLDGPPVVNRTKAGRVIPVKATVLIDGAPVVAGSVTLSLRHLATCSGAADDEVEFYAAGAANNGDAFRRADGRWIYNLSTAGLTVGECYRGVVKFNGADAGHFDLQIVR